MLFSDAIGGRHTLVRGPSLPPDSGSAAVEIVDFQNTTVTSPATGEYAFIKTGGAGNFDASAISNDGATGDFTLKITNNGYGGNGSAIGGMNSDPLADASWPGIDYAWLSLGASGWQLQSGGSILSGAAAWIWRRDGVIGMGRGATIEDAMSVPDLSASNSSTLYFDSSLYAMNDQLRVKLVLV